jgi:hypothetical protein
MKAALDWYKRRVTIADMPPPVSPMDAQMANMPD